MPGRSGRYEIDLLVLTGMQLTLIEIKNWAGKVLDRGDVWLQVNRSGTEISHENPIEKLKRKAAALTQLFSASGIRLPRPIQTRVILFNDNLLVPNSIRQDANVILGPDIRQAMLPDHGQARVESLARAVTEICLRRDPPASSGRGFSGWIARHRARKMQAILSRLETFDSVTLYGGRVIAGDLLRFESGGRALALKPRLISGHCVTLNCNRNRNFLFLKAILTSRPLMSFGRPLTEFRVRPGDELVFHEVGQHEPMRIDVARIVGFSRG